MKLNEISIYLSIAFVIYILVSLPALFISQPRMVEPDPDPEFEPFDIDIEPREFNPQSISQIADIIKIIGILFLAFLLYKILPVLSNYRGSKRQKEKRVLKEKEKIAKLKDARTEAYKLLREGLISQEYTTAFIKAYQTLDNDLQDFREFYRPTFWTPKEYSFAVREPIFRPSVYKFVKIFYDLRYGSIEAKEENLEVFILMLDYLFRKDVPQDTLEELSREYEEETINVNLRPLPRRGDPTKPRRN